MKLPDLKQFFKDARYYLTGTQNNSGAMEFPVGANITPEQTKKAYQTISIPSLADYQNPLQKRINLLKAPLTIPTKAAVKAIISPSLQTFSPRTPLDRFFLGSEDVTPLAQDIANKELDYKNAGFGKASLPLAFTLGIAGTTADLFPGLPEKEGAVNVLSKLSKEAEVANELRKLNVAEDIIKDYAPRIAETSDKAVISNMLDHIGELQKTTTLKTGSLINEVKTKPELFQQTRSLENLTQGGYEDYKVSEIMKNFDEKRLLENPISVGQFDNGEKIVTSGHNRLEVLRRAKASDLLTQPEEAYFKVTKYPGEQGLNSAIKESIDSNIRSKSIKDINVLDLAIKDRINPAEMKNALSFDQKKINFFDQIANTFKTNELSGFWDQAVGPKLAALRNLDFGALQEKLNFVNRIGQRLAERLPGLSADQALAVKNDIANEISRVLDSNPRTLQGVEKNINRYFDTVATGGYKNTLATDLFGQTNVETKVAKASKVQKVQSLIDRNLRAQMLSPKTRKQLEWVKTELGNNKGVQDFINATPNHQEALQKIVKVADQYDRSISKINKTKDIVDSVAKKLADKYGGRVWEAPIKNKSRTVEKVLTEYEGEFGKMGDLARNTIVVSSPLEAHQVAKEFENLPGVIKITDHYANPFWGYTDFNIKLMTSTGLPAEIQINTPEILVAKMLEPGSRQFFGDAFVEQVTKETGIKPGSTHLLYEKARPIDAKIKAGLPISSDEQQQLVALQQQSVSDYQRLEAALTRRLNSSADSSSLLLGSPENSLKKTPNLSGSNVPEEALNRQTRIPPSGNGSVFNNTSSLAKNLGTDQSPVFGSDINNNTPFDGIVSQPPANIKPEGKRRGFLLNVERNTPFQVAGQYIPRPTDELAIKARNLVREDIVTAERVARNGTDDTAVATASELLKHYSEQAARATDQGVKDAIYTKAGDLATDMAKKLTEQGRTIQAASILGRLTPEGQLKFASGLIEKYNETARVKIPNLTKDEVEKILSEMKAINNMDNGVEKAMRFQQLQNFIKSKIPSRLTEKIIAVWKAGLLTGIKTTGVNIFANLTHAASETIKDIPATVVDSVASLFTGERTKTFSLKGTGSGAREGFDKGLQYFKTGFDERNLGIKLDYNQVNFGKSKVGRALQTYEETIFRMLGSEDQPFYYGAKARSIADQAKAEAINKGLKGMEAQAYAKKLIANPTDKMLKYAVMDAETAVFQNQTVLGKVAKAIQKIPVLGEVTLPFGRTPAAVMTQVINYTPVGIATELFRQVGRGYFDQRLFSQAMGRALTGTGVLALGGALFAKGLMTLDRPTNEREQKLWELEGRKANSIKIGNKWRSIQILGPVGNVLLVGGQFKNAFQTSGSPTEAFSKGLLSSIKSFSEQTFLTGINLVTNALTDPEKSASTWIKTTLGSAIPTIVGDVARATDKVDRRTSSILDSLKAKIPGLRESLQPKIDVLGQEVTNQANPLEIMADPTRPSNIIETPVIRELRRLTDGGFAVSPTLLGDKNGYKGLTPEENTKLWQIAGQITNTKLMALFNSPEYAQQDDEGKSKLVDHFVDRAKTTARATMVVELTYNLHGDALKQKLAELKKSGLMSREVFNEYLDLK